MECTPPPKVSLTEDESLLYGKIPSAAHRDMEWAPVSTAMASLFKSLIERDAIPEIRLRVFADSNYAERHSTSPKQIFESNGTRGDDIYHHGHFIEYLHYFIQGPALPNNVITGYCQILTNDDGTSGMIFKQLTRYVRSSVRKYGLDRKTAATEFFRLAVELGDEFDPHSIRSAALSVR